MNAVARVGASGTRNLTCYDNCVAGDWEPRAELVRKALDFAADLIGLNNVQIVHGCCIGVDQFAAEWARYWQIPNHGVLPTDRSRVFPRWEWWCDTHEEITFGYTERRDHRAGFKRRNQRIVDLSDRLLAFPEYPERDLRSRYSGTWQTVRLAWMKGISTEVVILEGGGS